jgi:hypothetical protein
MAIPEAQLEIWSHRGSVTQSAATYQTIRTALEDKSAPYASKNFDIFLQGSYGNETNIFADSDVDIVIRLKQTYYSDLQYLTESAKANYDQAFSSASYGFPEFKKDVLTWLTARYGEDVKPGKKAIFIKGRGNRRDADVLVCTQHRLYWKTSNGVDTNYAEGVVFWVPDGTEIVNYPKQHQANCTTKHQNTNDWFKPMVRVYKNLRNSMIDDGYIQDGVAPSYFVEGMLWNFANDQYKGSYQQSFTRAFDWVVQSDQAQLTCANALHWLVRDGLHTSWSTANFVAFLAATRKYWNDWN